MQQIRITRTSDLDSVLFLLKGRYPLLSEAEIIKMALSNQYYHETKDEEKSKVYYQDPTYGLTKAEWKKKFAVFDQIREQISPEDEEKLDKAIDSAVVQVRTT